jgi:hypothetical protein
MEPKRAIRDGSIDENVVPRGPGGHASCGCLLAASKALLEISLREADEAAADPVVWQEALIDERVDRALFDAEQPCNLLRVHQSLDPLCHAGIVSGLHGACHTRYTY